MKRRSFVKTTVIGSAAAAIIPSLTKATEMDAKPGATEYYEIRVYHLKDEAQQKIVENYLQNSAIPALNSLGVKHVGIFTELKPEGQTKIFAIIQYNSLAHFSTVAEALEKDAEFKSKAAAYLAAPAAQPAYERIESSLLKAFTHMPVLTVPEKKTRIFELRQYQSASESAGKNKIDMFNEGGEIDIFKRLGFSPVFWGETVIGPLRPNLTYMVTFDDLAAKDAHWKAFGGDAQWKKISTLPQNADALLVSKITSTLLVPAEYSQI
jgi:hypothetical protein